MYIYELHRDLTLFAYPFGVTCQISANVLLPSSLSNIFLGKIRTGGFSPISCSSLFGTSNSFPSHIVTDKFNYTSRLLPLPLSRNFYPIIVMQSSAVIKAPEKASDTACDLPLSKIGKKIKMATLALT